MIINLWKRWFLEDINECWKRRKLPQLIVVDGGKGQLSSTKSLKKLNLLGEIEIIEWLKN